MALILKDRVLESSTSTGTGSFTLTGAQTGYQSFSAIGNGNTTYYTIQGKNSDGTLTGEWEVGVGTWSTGNTLSRDTVLSNSLGTTALISFSAGAKDVFVTYPSDKALLGDTSAVSSTGTGSVVLSDSPSLTGAVNIGGTTDTATLTLGRSTAAQTINIGVSNNTGLKQINIGTTASTGSNLITIGKLSATGTYNTKLLGNDVTVQSSSNLNLQALNINLNTSYIYMPNSFGQQATYVADFPTTFPAPQPGDRIFVADANNPRTGDVVTGGGLSIIPAYFDGSNWICDSGLGGTSGAGSVVLSSSPSISNPTISNGATIQTTTQAINIGTTQSTGNLTIGGASATGSTTLNGNVKLATKASLPTASAGLVEYDGSAFYNSVAASTRGVMPSEQYVILDSSYTLTSQTAAQKLFNASTNGAVNLPIGTYQFECSFSLTSLSAVPGSFGFAIVAGTAVIGSQGWVSIAGRPSNFSSTPASATINYNTTANTVVTASSAITNGIATIRGIIKITTAGTIIPSVSMTQASAAVVGANSYFKISPISGTSAANITVGNWS